MNRFIRGLAMLAVLVVAVAPAHAGIGDALKKKAASLVKGDKAKPAAASAEEGAITSRIQPPVTPESLARFKAGMEYEIAEREKAVKFLKTVKSKEAYQKCNLDWAMSPAGQKASQAFTSGMEGKSGEALQKHMETMGAEMEKALETHCGPSPDKYNDYWKGEQARAALAKASDDFAKGDDYAYHTWKEWVTEFCNYLEKLKKEPGYEQKRAQMLDEGLRIHTYGGNYYVYTASEAKHLIENCDTLMPLITATL